MPPPHVEDALVFLLQTLDLPTHSIEATEARLRVILSDRECVWQLMQDVDVARSAIRAAIQWNERIVGRSRLANTPTYDKSESPHCSCGLPDNEACRIHGDKVYPSPSKEPA